MKKAKMESERERGLGEGRKERRCVNAGVLNGREGRGKEGMKEEKIESEGEEGQGREGRRKRNLVSYL